MVNSRQYFGSDDHDGSLRSSRFKLHKSLVRRPCNLTNFCHCNGSALSSLIPRKSCLPGMELLSVAQKRVWANMQESASQTLTRVE
jgi:hypothetical protein